MGLLFNILDRVSVSSRMPQKIRSMAYNVREQITPGAKQINTLLSENRVEEAQAIVSTMPGDTFSRYQAARVWAAQRELDHEAAIADATEKGSGVGISDRKQRVSEARATHRAQAVADMHAQDGGVREDCKTPIGHEQADDLGPER